MKNYLFILLTVLNYGQTIAQTKILFDNTKGETSANADWIVDADTFNLCVRQTPIAGCGNEANPQMLPSPPQSGITAATPETYWKGALSGFAVDCAKKGYTIHTLPYNGRITYNDNTNVQDLTKYKMYVICEPNIPFTSAEKATILKWVYAGGGLLMIGNHSGSDRNNDGFDPPTIWNDFMGNANPFGITYDYTSFSQTTTNIVTAVNPITKGKYGTVTGVKYSAGTSMTLNKAANSTVSGVVYKMGAAQANTDVLVAYAKYGKGKVMAIGDSSPSDDGTGDLNDELYNGYFAEVNGSHRKLFLNSLVWLTGGAKYLEYRPDAERDDAPLEMALYPNPANSAAVLSASEAIQQVILSDMQGKQWLVQQPNAETAELPTAALPTGLYVVRYAVNEVWYTQKVLIAH